MLIEAVVASANNYFEKVYPLNVFDSLKAILLEGLKMVLREDLP